VSTPHRAGRAPRPERLDTTPAPWNTTAFRVRPSAAWARTCARKARRQDPALSAGTTPSGKVEMHRITLQTLRLGIAGLVLTSAAAVTGPDAHAAAFEAKTMRETLSAREVERPLILGKGWLEFGLGLDYKLADGAWDSAGEQTEWSDSAGDGYEGARFTHTTQRLDLRYGITRRGELYWTIKTQYLSLTNDLLETDTNQFGLGDPHFGYKFEVFRSVAPVTSVIIYGDYKASAGNESPGNYVGGPTTFSSFIMTTGTPDAEFGLRAKRQIGPVAIEAGAAYVQRFSGVVQYVIETEANQFSGRIKPGNITKGDAELLVGIGPVALDVGALVQVRDDTRIGSTAAGLFPAKNLNAVEESGGWSLDATGGFTFNMTRGIDLVGAVNVPLRGEDLMFFPIEDIHPTRGNTYSGTVEFRY
jgi:hypothetical protein